MKLKHIFLIILISSVSAFGSVALYNKYFTEKEVIVTSSELRRLF
jgi:hypothetical protein